MRFILVVNSGVTAVQAKNALTTYLNGRGWSVWHWFEDLWMIDGAEEMNLMEIIEQIKISVPGITHILAFSAEGKTMHSGFVPVESIPWIKEHWQPSKP